MEERFGTLEIHGGAVLYYQDNRTDKLNGESADSPSGAGFTADLELIWKPALPVIEDGKLYVRVHAGDGTGADRGGRPNNPVNLLLANLNTIADDNTNGNDTGLDLVEAHYTHEFHDNTLSITAGKAKNLLFLDGNAFANCEKNQFVGKPFVNNSVLDSGSEYTPLIGGEFKPTELLAFSVVGISTSRPNVEGTPLENTAKSKYDNVFSTPFLGSQRHYRPRLCRAHSGGSLQRKRPGISPEGLLPNRGDRDPGLHPGPPVFLESRRRLRQRRYICRHDTCRVQLLTIRFRRGGFEMFTQYGSRILISAIFFIMVPPLVLSAHGDGSKKEDKTAIILASFGTTIPSGIESIINIQKKIQESYPGVPVKLTFTSNIIRSVWKERQAEAKKWLGEGVPEEILYVKNIIYTFGELLEEGYRNIIVQPTHIFFMEQSHDLMQYVDAMRSIRTIKDKWKPFAKIALGRPALGTIGPRYDYTKDMEKALKTLADDVELAKKEKAALVYMGHGNEHWPSGIYAEAQKMMQELYPEVKTYIGVVEGFPGVDEVVDALAEAKSKSKTRKVVLKPFMIVAGDHALNDMAGDEEETWKSVLSAKKFQVIPVLKGLGSNDAFARIFVNHIRDAAKEAGIPLQ